MTATTSRQGPGATWGSALSRRQFLRAGALGLAGLTVLRGVPAMAQPGGPGRGPAVRTVPLLTDWRFGGRAVPGGTDPGFDDSDFTPVTLPHTVTALSWRNWDPDTWEDVWLYRRDLQVTPALQGMRVFLDFEGVLTGTTPTVNGQQLDEHLGGYQPFSYEITDLLTEGDNVLAVTVDGRFLYVPPNGSTRGTSSVDYLQPAGLYREVSLRAVPQVFLADVFAKPVDVLGPDRRVEVECTVDAAVARDARVDVELRDGGRVVSRASAPVVITAPGRMTVELTLDELGDIALWDVDAPRLYDVTATLHVGGEPVHDYATRIGFREARFEIDGFYLNGRRLKIFGVNRHQSFPYVGMAMPARVQRRDAEILKRDLNCNMVRCSHYPQSRHFLEACDELGLLAWEEVPGWQFLGDEDWQEFVVRDTEEMVLRDRNHPSIVIWGVRVNESPNNPELYTRTKERAYALDGSRQTSGAMVPGRYSATDYVQDVFSYDNYLGDTGRQNNLFRPPLQQLPDLVPPLPYLVSETVGTLVGPRFYRRIDPQSEQAAQAFLHAQAHNEGGSDDRYCGVLAWCGFDYASLTGNTFQNTKVPGVVDTFRVPKLGATFYQSQVDPRIRPVIEPAFYWDAAAGSPGTAAPIWSNCERLELFVGGAPHTTVQPALERFPFLHHPPFFADLDVDPGGNPELRIDGYVDDELVLSRSLSSDPEGDRLLVVADDAEIDADGTDATRVLIRAVDEHGAPRPYMQGDVTFSLDGPGELIGDNPFPFGDSGGATAVWVRTVPGQPGRIRLTASHDGLGEGTAEIVARPAGGGRVEVDAPPALVGGEPNRVVTRFDNQGPGGAVDHVELLLSAPSGWTVEHVSTLRARRLEEGGSFEVAWDVTPPAGAADEAQLTGTGSWLAGCIRETAEARTDVTVT